MVFKGKSRSGLWIRTGVHWGWTHRSPWWWSSTIWSPWWYNARCDWIRKLFMLIKYSGFVFTILEQKVHNAVFKGTLRQFMSTDNRKKSNSPFSFFCFDHYFNLYWIFWLLGRERHLGTAECYGCDTKAASCDKVSQDCVGGPGPPHGAGPRDLMDDLSVMRWSGGTGDLPRPPVVREGAAPWQAVTPGPDEDCGGGHLCKMDGNYLWISTLNLGIHVKTRSTAWVAVGFEPSSCWLP